MSEISSTTSAPWQNLDLTPKNVVDTATENAKGKGLTADFNTFLHLLTAQMKAQDPLNPMDNTEFIAQLASFSSVEQQVQGNQKLDQLIAAMSENSAGVLAQWLDKEVRTPARLQFTGEPLDLHPPVAPAGTASALVVVKDASGAEVAMFDMEEARDASGQVRWDGRTLDGGPAPVGSYAFEALYADASGATTREQVSVYDRVVEARLNRGVPELVLAGGGVTSPDAITGVRSRN